ncbi:Alpha/Beta hydrolase protein [Mucidula mucida]|nr:Alpha/Beta hydrolase protein [Mucidula mucida]
MYHRLLSLCLLFARSWAQDASPIVDLGYAKYQGAFSSSTNITRFRGIRYAAPPIGEIQHPPIVDASILDIGQNATMLGPACITVISNGIGDTNPYTGYTFSAAPTTSLTVKREEADGYSEDCLSLNVYIPGQLVPGNFTDLLPVLVFIHGGGYARGNGSLPGDDLIRGSGYSVLTVILQYRLGLFGFLAGQAVKDDGALNAGLLDQQYALRWVQTHIEKFGGDPERVTIWGESAGAGSVLQHVVANDGKTSPALFRGAITSSTFLPSQYACNDAIPEQLYSEVVTRANCSSSKDALSCLRQIDTATLEAINIAVIIRGFYGTFVFNPVVDGTFITQRPSEALRQRKLNGDMLYAVTNANEGLLYVDANIADTAVVADYLTQLYPKLSDSSVQAGAALYAHAGLGSAFDQVVAIMSESVFVCPSYFLLQAFDGSAFKAEFAIPPATHGLDVLFYFPSLMNGPPYTNTDFITAFAASFPGFASTLNPADTFETTIIPAWDRYKLKGRKIEMIFNRTEDGEPFIEPFSTSASLLRRCAFWESVAAQTGQ